MSSFSSLFFGTNRDLFVNFGVFLCYLTWFPITIANYPDGYLQINTALVATALTILLIGCLVHVITFIFCKDNRFSADLYSLSMVLLFVGAIVWFVGCVEITNDQCDLSRLIYNYGECWAGNIFVYISLFMMVLYLVMLISIESSIFQKIKDIFGSNSFRMVWLILTCIAGALFYILYAVLYGDAYTKALVIWFYCAFAFNLITIIISLIFRFNKVNDDHIDRFLILWFVLCAALFIFGCAAFWYNKVTVADAVCFWGETFVWTMVNIWLLAESFTQLKHEYKPIQEASN